MTAAGHDLGSRTLTSLFWQFLGVGGQRIVQLGAQVVLWRLLPDSDLGLFFVVVAAIGVIESLTVFVGEQASIWSDRGSERDYLDTVFTVRVLRSIVISGVLVPMAWAFAWYFSDPEIDARYWLPGLFLTLAANGLIDGVQSPARAARMKGLDFRRVALGEFLAALLGTAVTIGLAWVLRDVWALVLGHLAMTAMRSMTSYLVAPHRPRLRFEHETIRELFHYNVSAAGTPFLLVMVFSAGPLVVGKLIGVSAVAVYEGAGRLTKLQEDLFLRVLAPVALPAYAQIKNDRPRLARAWSKAVQAFLTVGVPLTISMAWCGDALPSKLWGSGYEAVPGLFALLAIHGGLASLTAVVGPLFWAIGEPRHDRAAQFYRALTIFGLGIPGTIYGGVIGFAVAVCLGILVALLYSLSRALPLLGLSSSEFAATLRGGILAGTPLLGVLLLADLFFSPTGWWRIATAALLGGPLLGAVTFRLVRARRREAAIRFAEGELTAAPSPEDRAPNDPTTDPSASPPAPTP